MYYLTGIQHTINGDVVIPVLAFESEREYKARFHHEMDYAYSNPDFIGMSIVVFDSDGAMVFGSNERWGETDGE